MSGIDSTAGAKATVTQAYTTLVYCLTWLLRSKHCRVL